MVQLKLVAGAHENVPLPVPFNEMLEPIHMETSGPALVVGNGFTVTATASVLVQLFPSVTTTEYGPAALATIVCVIPAGDH